MAGWAVARIADGAGYNPLSWQSPAPVRLPEEDVIGTYDADHQPNVATVALGGLCSQTPAHFFVAFGPKAYSRQNITEQKAFTVSVPSSKFLKEIDYVGLVSGRTTNKFAVCGLTPVASEHVNAPLIAELPISAECELRQSIDVGSHTMFVGEIVNMQADLEISTADVSELAPGVKDIPDILKAGGVVYAFTGDGAYYCSIGEPLEKAYTVGRALIKR